MSKRKYIILIGLLFSSLLTRAQLGGKNVYSFLNLTYSSRSAALGGAVLPMYDKDVTTAINNPAVLNADMHNYFNFSISNYLADIQIGSFSYAHSINEDYTGYAGLQYVNYGQFIKTDEKGNQLGTFTAGDYELNFAASRRLNEYWQFGMGLKFIYSTYESYTSWGLASDLGLSYHNKDKLLDAVLTVNHLGSQVKTYNDVLEPIPLNIQIAVAKKLEHAPLRFITVIHHLNDLDFTFIDPNKTQQVSFDNFGQGEPIVPPFSEKVFRHFIFAGEFVMSENFHLRVGYNHQRRKEMQIDSRPGMVGFSFGFGLRINRFLLNYAHSIYHFAGASNVFSISLKPGDFYKVKKAQ